MNSAQAVQFLRSCTGALSARSVARAPAYAGMRRAALARRLYSDDKAQQSTEQPQTKEGPADDAADASQESELVQKLKQKEAEVADVMGRLRYLQADFLNLQRNAAREKEQTRDFAITRFASDLLETVDVLAMALKSVPPSALSPPSSSASSSASSSSSSSSSSPSTSSTTPTDPSTPPEKSAQAYLAELYTGVEMTHRLLLQTLFKYHVKPFDPTGEVFDPNRHEALYQAPVPGKEPGTVLECQKTGYTIKDRVLRAAQVGVVQDTQS